MLNPQPISKADRRLISAGVTSIRQEELETAFDLHNRQLAEFTAEYPYIFPIVARTRLHGDVDSWCRSALDGVLDEQARRAEVMAWAAEHLTVYETFTYMIGIKDPDEAFWFRMAWT